MPKLEITIPHTLSQPEALTRVQNYLLELKSQHSYRISDLKVNWNKSNCNFQFTVSGFKISGTLSVNESEVIIIGNIPLVAVPFKSKIEAIIREQAEEILRRK